MSEYFEFIAWIGQSEGTEKPLATQEEDQYLLLHT